MRPKLTVIEGGKKTSVQAVHHDALLWSLWSLAFTIDAMLLWYVLFGIKR